MAIFGRNDNKKSAAAIKKWATTIAYGTQIKGEIVLTSSLHIDGEFEGTIHSDHVITISTQGRVIGDIIAKGIIIVHKNVIIIRTYPFSTFYRRCRWIG